ncbi:MAG TPA: ABC transporter substrate-binding protein [Alphaproteobacteria bacterium]
MLTGLAVGWAITFSLGTTPAQALDRDAASALIGQVTHEAVASLTAKGLSGEERAQAVRDLIARYSSSEKLSEEILGRAWATASAVDRARFENRFVEYVVALCAGMLKDMSPETKILVNGAEARGDLILVHTVVTAGDDDRTPVEWSVAATPDGRLILADVSTEGVSLIKTMRSDFRAVLFANGGRIEALIATMNHKIRLAANTN